MPISCLLEDIDPILKIFESFKPDLRDFPAPVFRMCCKYSISEMLRFPKLICVKSGLGFFLNYSEIFGVSQSKNNWFWESWRRPPSPKNIKIMGVEFS